MMSSLRLPKYVLMSLGWDIKTCSAGFKWNLWLLWFKRFLAPCFEISGAGYNNRHHNKLSSPMTSSSLALIVPFTYKNNLPLAFLSSVQNSLLNFFYSILFIQQILNEIVYSQRLHMIWRIAPQIVVSALYLCKYLSYGPYMSVAFKPLQSCVLITWRSLHNTNMMLHNIFRFTVFLRFVFLFLTSKRYLAFYWDLGNSKSTLLCFLGNKLFWCSQICLVSSLNYLATFWLEEKSQKASKPNSSILIKSWIWPIIQKSLFNCSILVGQIFKTITSLRLPLFHCWLLVIKNPS